MRRVLTLAVLAILLAAVSNTTALGPASADTRCSRTDPTTGECLIWVDTPATAGPPSNAGNHGPKDTGSGSACYWDGTPLALNIPPPRPMPCQTEHGYWSNAELCYLRLATPQPDPGSPFWEGSYVDFGAVYECYRPQTDQLVLVWFADPPPNSGSGPTPREVAQQAINRMGLHAIDIGITPSPSEDSIGIVGMPVWMWAARPSPHTVGPITASASAGGITIAATATLHQITWSMGDGTDVVCKTAGTPYKPGFGKKASPDCGHVYDKSSSHQPQGKYTVTATSDWVITWEGAGQTGTIRLNGLTRSAQISVGEAQVLVQ